MVLSRVALRGLAFFLALSPLAACRGLDSDESASDDLPTVGGDGGGGAGAAPVERTDGAASHGDTLVPHGTSDVPVRFSELMYHPVLENAVVDNHEFIELYNQSATAVSLAGWKLVGVVSYAFPAGTSIAPGQYLVVAKNRQRLAEVAAYKLTAANLLGDYDGDLDNGGGQVMLLDAADALVDAVDYNDKFPWPVAADALGAGESWLPAELLPLTKHQYMG